MANVCATGWRSIYALVLVIAAGAVLMAVEQRPDCHLRCARTDEHFPIHSRRIPAERPLRGGRSQVPAARRGLLGYAALRHGAALWPDRHDIPSRIAAALRAAPDGLRAGYALAAVMVAAGFGFKMAIVPFQMWVPDVYEGAPTPVTAYLSVASKAAAFAVALRVFYSALGGGFITSDWANFFAVIAAVSMTVGNVLAMQQRNIKRLFGYSSVAQAGNFVVGLAAISAAQWTVRARGERRDIFPRRLRVHQHGRFHGYRGDLESTGSDEIADYAGMGRRSPCSRPARVLPGFPDRHSADRGIHRKAVYLQCGSSIAGSSGSRSSPCSTASFRPITTRSRTHDVSRHAEIGGARALDARAQLSAGRRNDLRADLSASSPGPSFRRQHERAGIFAVR